MPDETPAPSLSSAPLALTPEELSAFEKSETDMGITPAVNPVKDFSAQELADFAIQDPGFDIVSTFRNSADLHGDPATVQKAADALDIVKQRGFKLEDLPSLPEAGKVVLHTAEGFGKQLWNYANAAGGIVQTAIADVVGATEFSGASADEVSRRLAANLAGTEEAMTGLSELGQRAASKAARILGGPRTSEQKVADLWADVGRAETQQQRLTGKGAFTQAVTRGTAPELNPEETATLAAGDPFSFYLFGATAKGVGALVPKGVSTAVAAGTKAATEAAGTAARVVGGKVIQGTGKAVGGTAGLVEKVAPIVSPIAGAVKGGGLYGPAGVAGGFVAGERVGKILATGARRVGTAADSLAELGRDIASSAPVKSAYAQAGRDFLQSMPGAVFETAKGAAIDLGLAAASAETPAETQGAAAFGTVLGGLHGAAKIGGRVISGQLIAPREYGISTPQPSSGAFPAFDTIHKEAFQTAPPGVKARLNALRKFTSEAAGTDVFYTPDPVRLSEALQSSGMTKEQADSWSQHQGFFTAEMPDKTGTPRKIVVVTTPDAAPHESYHAIQDVLGEQGNQAVDQIVRESYGNQWDKQGTDYANRLAGGDLGSNTWQETILDHTGKGMAEAKEKVFQQIYNSLEGKTGGAPSRALVESLAKEAYGRIMDEAVAKNPQIPPDQIALHAWREILSPEEAGRVADTFMARELAAENFDAIFKHTGPTLAEPNSLPAKLARIAGRVMTALGAEPLSGRVSELSDTSLSAPVVEAVRRQAQGLLPEVTMSPRGKQAPLGKAPAGTPAEEAARAKEIADESPTTPTENGTMTQREMLGKVAESIAGGEGVKINYLSAPEEPAASTTSNRQARRDIIEAFRDMPAAARSLWEKTFFPERVRKTRGGKYQVFGWAPEVFAANAHKMATFLTAHPELSPYAIDAATKSFTPAAWQELYKDTQTFVQNQKAGQTGSGEPLVVPKSMTDRGFTAPASRAGDAVPLDQNKADFINLLFNAKLPETPRLQKGKTPLNIAGQTVSDATLPGRVEVPVRPRGEYTGAEAERQGIAGREIAEVNPLRNAIEAAALADKKPMPSLIEANQMLNLENIKELERAPEQPEFRANTLTLQAGFAPGELIGGQFAPKESSGVETIRAAAVRWKPTGELFTGFMHSMALDQAFEKGVVPGIKSFEELYNLPKEQQTKIESDWDTGFYTSNDRFVSRSEAATIGEAAGQLRAKHEAGTPLDSDNVEMVAQFAPKDAMEKLKNLPDAEWQEQIGNYKGKYGGGLTGWAYEIGSQAKTVEDLQAFRTTGALLSETATAAMKAGQFDKAMELVARAQAAHEAYEAATGTKTDGQVKDVAKFIRERHDPTFEYSMPAKTISAAFAPAPFSALAEAERAHARNEVRLESFRSAHSETEIYASRKLRAERSKLGVEVSRSLQEVENQRALARTPEAVPDANTLDLRRIAMNQDRALLALARTAGETYGPRKSWPPEVQALYEQRRAQLEQTNQAINPLLPSWTVETVGKSLSGQRNIRVVDENGETVEIRSGFRGTDAEALADASSNRAERESYRNSEPGTTPRPATSTPSQWEVTSSREQVLLDADGNAIATIRTSINDAGITNYSLYEGEFARGKYTGAYSNLEDARGVAEKRYGSRTPIVSPALETKAPSEEKRELRSGQKLLFPEKRLPVWPRVVELWKELGKEDDLAKYGTSKSNDPQTIARELSIPEETIRAEESSGDSGDVEYKSLDFGRERDGNVIEDPDYVQERANDNFDDVRAELIKDDLEDRLVELRKYHDAKGNLTNEKKLDKAASEEALRQAEREYNDDPPREWSSDIGDYVIRYDGQGGEYHITSGLGRNPRNSSFSTFDEARDRAGENALDRGLLDPENSGSETGDISFSNDKGRITIVDAEGDPQIDAMGSRKRGGGAGLYKAAFTWAHNIGKTIGVGSLTAVNSKRRTSNMLSFALQTGDTSFTRPGYAQKVPWTAGAHELNIENLLRREMEYVFEEAPKLKNLRFDTKSGMFADEAGKKYNATTIDDKLKLILEPYRSSGGHDFATGVATAKRAILTSSFLRTLDASSVAKELQALKAGGKAGGTGGLLGEVLYAPKDGVAPVVEGRNAPLLIAPPNQDEIEIEPRNLRK